MLNREDVLKLIEITKKIDEEMKTNPDGLSYNLSSNWSQSKSAYLEAAEKFYDYANDKEVAVKLALAKNNDYEKVSLADISDELKNDKETLIELINSGCECAVFKGYIKVPVIPEQFLADKDVMLAAIKMDDAMVDFADNKLFKDREFALAQAKLNTCLHYKTPDDFLNDKDFVLEAVQSNASFLKGVNYPLRGDKEVTLAAVKQDGRAMEYVADKLRADKDVALTALKTLNYANEDFFKNHISRSLRQNPEFMAEAIKIDSNAYKYAFKKIEYHRDVLKSFYEHGRSLYGDTPELRKTLEENKNDKEFWKSIVNGDYALLKYASDEIRADKDIALIAVSYGRGYALEYFNKSLKDDKDIVMMAIEDVGYPLRHASDRLKDDEEVVMQAVKVSPTALAYASQRFQDDYDLALKAIDNNTRFISDGLSQNLLNDKDFVEMVIYNKVVGYEFGDYIQSNMYRYASEEIRSDKTLALTVLSNDGQAICFVPNTFKNDKEIVETALQHKHSYNNTYDIFKYAGDNLKDDKQFVMDMINKFKDAALFAAVSDRLKDDVEVVKAAKAYENRYYPVMKHCSERIQKNPELLEQKPQMSLKDRLEQAKAMRESKEPSNNNPSKNRDDYTK